MRARAIVGSIPLGFRGQNLAGSLDDTSVEIGGFSLDIFGDTESQCRIARVTDQSDRPPRGRRPYDSILSIEFKLKAPCPPLRRQFGNEHKGWRGIAAAGTAGKGLYCSTL